MPVPRRRCASSRAGAAGRRCPNRNVFAVREAQQDTAGARIGADDPVRKAPCVDDAVHDRRGAGDRAAGRNRPADPAAPGRNAVEQPVVGAEEDAACPDCGRRVDVAPGVDAPEIAAAGRERGQRPAVGRGHEDAPAPDRRRAVDTAVHPGRPAQTPVARRKREQSAAVVADVEGAAGERGARGDLRAAVVNPPEATCPQVQRVDVAVQAPK
jgi:hypothetical protein